MSSPTTIDQVHKLAANKDVGGLAAIFGDKATPADMRDQALTALLEIVNGAEPPDLLLKAGTALTKVVKDGDAAQRLAAVQALAGTSAPEAVKVLASLLHDADSAVREAAAEALDTEASQGALQALVNPPAAARTVTHLPELDASKISGAVTWVAGGFGLATAITAYFGIQDGVLAQMVRNNPQQVMLAFALIGASVILALLIPALSATTVVPWWELLLALGLVVLGTWLFFVDLSNLPGQFYVVAAVFGLAVLVMVIWYAMGREHLSATLAWPVAVLLLAIASLSGGLWTVTQMSVAEKARNATASVLADLVTAADGSTQVQVVASGTELAGPVRVRVMGLTGAGTWAQIFTEKVQFPDASEPSVTNVTGAPTEEPAPAASASSSAPAGTATPTPSSSGSGSAGDGSSQDPERTPQLIGDALLIPNRGGTLQATTLVHVPMSTAWGQVAVYTCQVTNPNGATCGTFQLFRVLRFDRPEWGLTGSLTLSADEKRVAFAVHGDNIPAGQTVRIEVTDGPTEIAHTRILVGASGTVAWESDAPVGTLTRSTTWKITASRCTPAEQALAACADVRDLAALTVTR